jgi:hypothetical protein
VDPEITTAKLLLVEYERLKEEQKTRIGFRDNLIYATLASMAAVIAAALSSKGQANLLLLLPAVSVLLGWTYVVNDEKVSALGRYIRGHLEPNLVRLTGSAPDLVFQWEVAHRSDRRRRSRKVLQVVVDVGTFCVTACAAIVVFWVNGPRTWPFLVLSFVELALVLALAVEIVRYADLGVGGAVTDTPAPAQPQDPGGAQAGSGAPPGAT